MTISSLLTSPMYQSLTPAASSSASTATAANTSPIPVGKSGHAHHHHGGGSSSSDADSSTPTDSLFSTGDASAPSGLDALICSITDSASSGETDAAGNPITAYNATANGTGQTPTDPLLSLTV